MLAETIISIISIYENDFQNSVITSFSLVDASSVVSVSSEDYEYDFSQNPVRLVCQLAS